MNSPNYHESQWIIISSVFPKKSFVRRTRNATTNHYHCAYIMNCTARKALGWRTPYKALYGQKPDISVMLKFVFWELCYIANYKENGASFPSESTEIAVRMIGFSESVGHSITFKVYNEDRNTVLFRSGVRKIIRGSDVNNRINPAPPPPPPPGPSPMSSADDPTISEVLRS